MQDLSLFTYKEAINMILGFQTFLQGFWEFDLKDLPEVKRFIEMGYAEKDQKYTDLYVLSETGGELIHEYIKNISEIFIEYMKTRGQEATYSDVQRWFKEKFGLETEEDGAEIAHYICDNLSHYGYRIRKCYSSRKGNFYMMDQICDES